MKIIISPHYDDAILSTFSKIDSNFILITVFTKHNAEIFEKSNNSLKCYLNYPVRKTENNKVSNFLGIKNIDLNYPEECFRNNEKLLKNNLVSDIKKIIGENKVNTIYIPLGIGYHTDHLLVFDLLKNIQIQNKYFYFDYPYCSYKLATKTRLSDFGIFNSKLNFNDIIQFNNNLIYPSFVRKYHIIKNLGRYLANVLYFNLFNRIFNFKIFSYKIDIKQKSKAIEFYKSQINPIFGSLNLMIKHLSENPYENFIVLEKNNNYNHKFYFLLYLVPYAILYKLINNIYFTIFFSGITYLFYKDLTKIKEREIVKMIRSNLKFYFLIPFFNEESNIKSFIQCLPEKENISYIFINDCSEDDSRNILLNNLRKDFIFLERKTKANVVAQVLNIGLEYLNNINEIKKETFIGLLNCDSIFDSNSILKITKLISEYNIDVLNMRNRSINIINWISNIASEEKEFKFFLSKYGNVNLNNGYLIKSSLFKRYSNSWTEDLVLGNESEGIKYQSEIILYDIVPNKLYTLLRQKFRWIRGDIYYRISRFPRNIFDLIINIYYLIPFYFILDMIFKNYFSLIDLILIIFVENLLYYKFTNNFNLTYSIKQQIINLLFYFYLILFPFEW